MKLQFCKSLKYLMLPILCLGLTQCGKAGDEENFQVSMATESPLVHETSRTLGDATIDANWFDLSFTITNGMQRSVKIEDVVVYVKIDGVESGPHTVDLGALSWTDGAGNKYDYTYCIYTKGSVAIAFAACLYGSVLDPTLGYPLALPIVFFVDGLPKPKSPTNFAYPSRIVMKGIVLDENGNDTERFEKQTYFTTR